MNVGLLIIFKYANFITANLHTIFSQVKPSSIALPIGISFYTFQILSYIIDIYRGEIKVQKNILDLGLYISLFPQLIAGPIVKYRDVQKEIQNRSITWEETGYGIKRFILGLSKKVLISNALAKAVDAIFSTSIGQIGTLTAWSGALCYTLQIYYDFSGYSDMAIGLGRMLGFKFCENFNYPYCARSIKEFWQRWHISLSSWFKEYLYIPLGGNRKGVTRTYLNLLIVFMVTGFWHGANWTFFIWGLFHGMLQLLERGKWGQYIRSDKHIILSHVYTLLMIIIGWIFFRSDTLGYAASYLSRMFIYMPEVINHSFWTYINTEIIIVFIFGVLFSGRLTRVFSLHIFRSHSEENISFAEVLVLIFLYLLCIAALTSDAYNPFIYFRF